MPTKAFNGRYKNKYTIAAFFEETIKNLPIEEMDFFRGDYIRKLKRDAYYGIYKVL